MKKTLVFDAGIGFFACLIIGLISFLAYTAPVDNSMIMIKTEEGEYLYPTDTEKTVHLHGPLGETVVEIGDGYVMVLSSPCTEKICISSSPINKAGTWIACLPNKIFIRIEGKNDEEVDAGSF